jgi:hypothetical protein
MEGGTGKLKGKTITTESGEEIIIPREYVFNDTIYDAFEVNTKKYGVRTTELGDTVLNGYIDNVKELITGIINANGHTINMIGTMISLGIDIDTITYFMQQPIVRHITSNPSGINSKIRKSKKFMTGKIGKKESDALQDPNIKDSDLINNIRFDASVNTIFKKEQLLEADLEDILSRVRKSAIQHAKGKLNTWQSKRSIKAGKGLKERGNLELKDIISPKEYTILEEHYPGISETLQKLEDKINRYINDKEDYFKTIYNESELEDGTIDVQARTKAKEEKAESLSKLFIETVESTASKKEADLQFFVIDDLANVLKGQEEQKDRLFEENKEFYKSQLAVLNMFEKINDLSSEIESNTKFLKIVKDLPVDYSDMSLVSDSDTSTDLVAPLTNVPNIGAAAARLNFLKELVENVFVLYNPYYTKYFTKMLATLGFNTEGSLHSPYEKIEIIRGEFEKYLMTGVMELVPTEGYIGFNASGGLTKDPKKVKRFTSERELRVQILINKINKELLKIKGNKFADLLKPRLTRKGNPRLEFLAGTNLDPTQELELQNAYLQLPTEAKQLLIQYAAIVEGAQFGFKSFSKFIPPTESEPGANDGLDFISQKFEEILSSLEKSESKDLQEIISGLDLSVFSNFEKQFTYLNRDQVKGVGGLAEEGNTLVFNEPEKVKREKLPNYVYRKGNMYKLVNLPDLVPYYEADGVIDNNNYVFKGQAPAKKRITLNNSEIIELINSTPENISSKISIENLATGDYAVYSRDNSVDTSYVVSVKDEGGTSIITGLKQLYRQSITSKSKPISEVKLKKTLDVLKKNTGMDYTTDPTEFKKALSEAGHTGEYPAGFVYKGKVYINTTGEGNMYGADTALHEYAHLYIDHIRKTNPTLYNRILTLAAENKFYDAVKEQYPNLSGNDLLEEVAVTFIGTQGQRDRTILGAIKRVLRSLGIESFTTLEDLANDLLTKNLELENVELESVMSDINKLREQMISSGQIKIEYNELCK